MSAPRDKTDAPLREGHLREGHLREGFTTGSAAAAAARAATLFALTGAAPQRVDIPLPPPHQGRLLIPVAEVAEEGLSVRAAVVKDGGDDPDATHGARIEALVTVDPAFSGVGPHVLVGGGAGVGRVTLPGLAVAVGQAAINPGPVEQIRLAVREVLPEGFTGIVLVVVEVPEGEAIARHTLNPRLGIAGGISILGTGGVVRPYSHEAWIRCVEQSLDVARAAGHACAVLTTGRRSERLFAERFPAAPEVCLVQAADYCADALRAARARGFQTVIWSLFFGKLAKQGQGFANTHARAAALDLAWLSARAREAGATRAEAAAVAQANTAAQALALLPPRTGRRLAELLARLAQEAAAGFAPGLVVRHVAFAPDGSLLFADAPEETLFSPAAPLHPAGGSR